MAGTDGRLRAFANHAQYVADGYDPSQLIEVGGLTDFSFVRGTPASAPALRADGALVVAPNHRMYVLAGGMAFAIYNRSELAAIGRVDHARLVRGSVPESWRVALPVRGVLFTVFGRGVFVSYEGALYGPASAARLSYGGYVVARAIPVPGTEGLRTIRTA